MSKKSTSKAKTAIGRRSSFAISNPISVRIILLLTETIQVQIFESRCEHTRLRHRRMLSDHPEHHRILFPAQIGNGMLA